MIKFFRTIRKKLLSENKIARYSLYATGEIILVVVGILLALQINNANEKRKENKIVDEYYNQILTDIESDIAYMNEISARYDSSQVEYVSFRETYKQPDLPLTQILFSMKALKSGTIEIQFQSNTIAALQSSGDINMIPLHVRNTLIKLKQKEDMSESISMNRNQLVADMALYATRYLGYPDYIETIQNQPKIISHYLEEDRLVELIFAGEAYHNFRIDSESYMRLMFENVRAIMADCKKLIKAEQNK